MKTNLIILTFIAAVTLTCSALAGPAEPVAGAAGKSVVLQASPPVAASPYKDSEFNIALFGTGSWTVKPYLTDRYLGVDHAFGGTLAANYFFAKYFGAGLSFTGYDARNLSTPARIATSTDKRRFVGDTLLNATFRYPIGTSPFAPYVRVGGGPIFNGGNRALQEPTGSAGKTIQFELAEHDVTMVAEGAIGVEYRFNHNFGILTEAAFDKVTRPHSNFGTVRVGVNVAF